MAKAVDLTGKRFGRLVAIEPTNKRLGNNIVWKCKCDCGKETEADVSNLKVGNKVSCGCVFSDLSKKKLEKFRQSEGSDEKLKKSQGVHDGTMDCRLNNNLPSNNKTGVRGVALYKGRFKAYIRYKGKLYHLGYFYTLKDAKEARKIAEKKIWGKDLE